MNRKLLWAVLAIGLALVIAPLAMGLPGKAAAGQRMLDGFQPIMQPDQVKTTAYYYDDVFVPLGRVTPMLSASNVHRLQASMESLPMQSPAMRTFGGLMGVMERNVGVFAQVPAGLAHYKPLVTTMQANVGDFAQVNSLPDFRLFTWFFVVPGALLVLLAGFGLFGRPLSAGFPFHHHRARPTPA
jgi:hypothetical protein